MGWAVEGCADEEGMAAGGVGGCDVEDDCFSCVSDWHPVIQTRKMKMMNVRVLNINITYRLMNSALTRNNVSIMAQQLRNNATGLRR